MLLTSAKTLISAYQPEEPRERGFRLRMLELLQLADPTSRRQFNPGHLTASAFVLSPARDAVLLILHKKLGLWLQPGGHIEPSDETLLAAAQREVLEEVGLTLEAESAAILDLDIHSIPARKDEPAHEHFDVRFYLQAPTLEFTRTQEVADVRWAPLAQIEHVTTDESVLRVVRKLAAATPPWQAPPSDAKVALVR